jgi:hypothetical protein
MSINSEAYMAVAFFVSAASVCWSAAFAWAKWLQHSRNNDVSVPALDKRLERIEQAIDAVAVEVERLGEGQRFAARLLRDANDASSAKGSASSPESYRVNTPH